MPILIDVKQEGSLTVRAKYKDGLSSGSAVGNGVLIGRGRNGFVTRLGNTINVYEANGRRKANFPESKWPEKRWEFSPAYC